MVEALLDILMKNDRLKAAATGRSPVAPAMQAAQSRQAFSSEQTPGSHILPSNLRWMAQSMVSPRPMTGKDISPQEHAALLRAHSSSGDRVDLMTKERKDALTGVVNELKQYPPNKIVNYGGVDAPAHEHLTNVGGQLTKSLQYSDYPPFRKEGKGIDSTPVLENLTDPSYSMSTTIGRAHYVTEADGSVHIKDTYNFPGKDETTSLAQKLKRAWTNRDRQNLALGIPEAVAAHFSKDMPVDIQLTPGRPQMALEQAAARQGAWSLPKPGYNIDENNQLDQLQQSEGK